MATTSDSDVAGAIESLLGLASSTECSNPPVAESCPLTKPMKEVILEGIAKEIDSARGSTENPYGMKNNILQKWQTNFSWLNRNTLNYYLRKTRPSKNIQLALQAEVSDLTELLAQQMVISFEVNLDYLVESLPFWHTTCYYTISLGN